MQTGNEIPSDQLKPEASLAAPELHLRRFIAYLEGISQCGKDAFSWESVQEQDPYECIRTEEVTVLAGICARSGPFLPVGCLCGGGGFRAIRNRIGHGGMDLATAGRRRTAGRHLVLPGGILLPVRRGHPEIRVRRTVQEVGRHCRIGSLCQGTECRRDARGGGNTAQPRHLAVLQQGRSAACREAGADCLLRGAVHPDPVPVRALFPGRAVHRLEGHCQRSGKCSPATSRTAAERSTLQDRAVCECTNEIRNVATEDLDLCMLNPCLLRKGARPFTCTETTGTNPGAGDIIASSPDPQLPHAYRIHGSLQGGAVLAGSVQDVRVWQNTAMAGGQGPAYMGIHYLPYAGGSTALASKPIAQADRSARLVAHWPMQQGHRRLIRGGEGSRCTNRRIRILESAGMPVHPAVRDQDPLRGIRRGGRRQVLPARRLPGIAHTGTAPAAGRGMQGAIGRQYRKECRQEDPRTAQCHCRKAAGAP